MDETVYYVCKYTPIEIIEGMGFRTERIDPSPLAFECADSCAHPNLCGYGKAVLEEVMSKGIRRLILVDCCDVCRRIFDVMKVMGNMEFLFLFSLPHKNGVAEQMLVENELYRLIKNLQEITTASFDPQLALQIWNSSRQKAIEESIDAPHLSLIGAHGGDRLLKVIRERSVLPVSDGTCTGNRVLPAPTERADLLVMLDYASALLRQHHPCMRMQFREERQDSKALGLICHTVKFCDYYSFQYKNVKENGEKPLLKIETDCSSQSSGQIETRIEAFCEALGVRRTPQLTHKSKALYVAGIDSGSASTDAVILNRKGEIVGSAILPTGAGATSGAEKALEAALKNAALQREQIGAVVTTGYGRNSITQGDASVTEITCHAKGAHHLYPRARAVIDIGGQDSKVICLDDSGQIINFVMNDKCAAGTGRFLEMMAHILGLSLQQMSEIGLRWKRDVAISSMCTVFAESEVVSLIADNTEVADIVHGLNGAVAAKTVSMIKRAGAQPEYMMTGGVAQNRGVVKALEERIGEKIFVPNEAQLCGALGAALIALDSAQ